MCRLVDADVDRQRLVRAAVAHTANRRSTEVIETDRDPDMGVSRADAVGGVERDPTEGGNEGFRPGMPGLLLDDAVVPAKMAADITRRDAEVACGGQENMGEVLANAALEREGFRSRRCRERRIGVELHLAVQSRE